MDRMEPAADSCSHLNVSSGISNVTDDIFLSRYNNRVQRMTDRQHGPGNRTSSKLGIRSVRGIELRNDADDAK